VDGPEAMTPEQRARDKRAAEARGFTKGYVCAVATLAKAYGDLTYADELLRALGKINWRLIDEYDREVLRGAGIVLNKYS